MEIELSQKIKGYDCCISVETAQMVTERIIDRLHESVRRQLRSHTEIAAETDAVFSRMRDKIGTVYERIGAEVIKRKLPLFALTLFNYLIEDRFGRVAQ